MTANQIAYLSAQEQVRHDKVYETETSRHNQRMEEIEADKNAIQQESNALQAGLGAEKNRIQEDYNKWFAKWTEASGRTKLELEAEGNAIQRRKTDVEEAYRIRANEIESMRIGTIVAQNAETKRHNKELEYLQSTSVWNDQWWREKELEYKEHQLDLTNQWKVTEFQIARDRLDQEGVKITADANWHASTYNLAKDQFDLEYFKKYNEGVFTPVLMFTEALGNVLSPFKLKIGK